LHDVAFDLLILLAGIWLVAVTLRPLGLPTVMGELIVGVLLGPAVLGWIEPNEAIRMLAEIGIFFLMFHAGVETQPVEFFDALKRSMGVALVGAIVPFGVSFGVATHFGLDLVGATFVGLVMTATAVVITLKSLTDLGLANTRVARVILASCVIDDLLTLVFFGLVIGVLSGGSFEPAGIAVTLGKVVFFLAVAVVLGRYVYPRMSLPFRSEGGKGFTFVLAMAIAMGLLAEAIGLHMILGAYLAGLFFEEKVAHPNLVRVVKDRAYGIAYSFLGPIFFISLGFSVTFDISAVQLAFIAVLTLAVIAGQVLSAGGMALRMGLPPREALTVGVGMCGRAEIAFILAALALSQGAIDQSIFSALLFVAFALNLFTPLGLKGCAIMLRGEAERMEDATSGIVQVNVFGSPLVQEQAAGRPLQALPDLADTVVIYRWGPAVESLLEELGSRDIKVVVIEQDSAVAERLGARGVPVVKASLTEEELDLRPLAKARAIVSNGADEDDALLAVSAREMGFGGPFVALIENPYRRGPLQLAGATAAFTPSHVLAAAVAMRASPRIGPRITGVRPLADRLEVAEIRIHENSPLLDCTIGDFGARTSTGVQIVGHWVNDALRSPPASDATLQPGMILVAAGSPGDIRRLSEITRPITQHGAIVVAGYGEVGSKLAEMLRGAGETVCVVHPEQRVGVDVVGDVFDRAVLEQAGVAVSRVVILACASDSATLLAAKVVRDYAPDVPIIACAEALENVVRIQEAGADYALSISQVAGQLLAYHVIGKMVSQQARIKMVKLGAGPLAGLNPLTSGIRSRTGCTIVAVERAGEVIMNFAPEFEIDPGDALYVCGTPDAFERFHEAFPDPSGEQVPPAGSVKPLPQPGSG